jgi:hypothetical protein
VAGYYSATRQHNAAAPLADFCTAAYIALSAKTDVPKGGRKPLSQKDRIMQFVEERLRPGEDEVTPAEIRSALHNWWQVKCPATPVPSDRAVSAVLTNRAGITKKRPGGYVRYAAALVS